MAGEQTLAQRLKAKYPQYGQLDDAELERRILAKYPQYKDLPLTKKATDVVAPVAASATPATKETESVTWDIPGPKEFGSRMARQLVSPIGPLHKQGRRLATAIDGAAPPATGGSPLVESVKQQVGEIKTNPVKGTFKAAAGLTGIPTIVEAVKALKDLASITMERPPQALDPYGKKGSTIDSNQPDVISAALKGGAAGTVEGLSKLSPLEMLMLSRFPRKPTAAQAAKQTAKQVTKAEVRRADARASLNEPALAKGGKIVRPAGKRAPVPEGEVDPFSGLADANSIQEALEMVLRDEHTTNTMPPSESPSIPKTLAAAVTPREGPVVPGRPLGGVVRPSAEPAGALGLAEESAAAARGKGSIREMTKKFATEKDLAELRERQAKATKEKKVARDKDIDDIAEKAEREAFDYDDDAPIPGTTRSVAYGKGATPAQAGATASAQRAAESVAAKSVPRESLVVDAAAPGAKAGQAKLPSLKKTNKAVGQPAASALPERKTVSGEIKAADNRKKLMGTLRKFESGNSQLDQKVRRIVYLGELEKVSAAQGAEMASLEKTILAHKDVPDILKKRWTRVNQKVAESQRPSTKVMEAVAARDKLPTKANGDTRPLTQRGEDLAARISKPKPEPKAPAPEDVAAAVDEALPKPPGVVPAKAEAPPVATPPPAATAPEVPTTPVAPGPSAALGPYPQGKTSKAAAAVAGGKGRPKAARTLGPLLEQSRQALPKANQAIAEMGGQSELAQALAEFLPEGGDVAAAGSRAASQITQEFGTGTGYRPNVPSRSTLRMPKGFTGPTQRGTMKQSPIVRKAADLKAKFMASYKKKPVKTEERAPAVTSRMEAAEIPVIRKPIEQIGRAQTLREKQALDQMAGPVPKGVDQDQWRRINAVENEARELVKDGIHDPRLLKEMIDYWGAKETVTRTGLSDYMKPDAAAKYIRDLTGSKPRQRPTTQVLAEMDARFRHLIDDPNGFFRVEALATGAGALTGGLAGATIEGEDAGDRFAYALSGAILGGALGNIGIRGVKAAANFSPGFKKTAQYAEVLDTASLLASPAAIKASFGSMAGVAAGLWEKLYTGDIAGFRRGMQAVKEAPGIYRKTLLGPTRNLRKMGHMSQQIANQTGMKGVPERVLLNVLRPFIAADKAATHVLQRAGFSLAEGDRQLLMGTPVSWQGQTLLNYINSNMAFRMLAKFPRVRIGALERAVEYTPGLSAKYGQAIRSRRGRMGKFDPQETISKKQLRARAIFGGATIAAGSAYGYWRDPGLAEAALATSAAGPAQIPAAVGVALGKAIRKGTTGTALAVALGEPIAASVPQISESDIRMLPERFIPGAPAARALRRWGLID